MNEDYDRLLYKVIEWIKLSKDDVLPYEFYARKIIQMIREHEGEIRWIENCK
jgi:hypothetical protein